MIAELALACSQVKISLERMSGLSGDVLHAFTGVIVLVAVHTATRRSTPRHAWLAVLGVESLNEMLDMSRPAGAAENDWAASLHDLWITLFLPTVLVFLWPALTRPRTSPAPDDVASKESVLQ